MGNRALDKQLWLDRAELFDTWRIVPRAALACFGGLGGWATIYIVVWYAHLPAIERTGAVTAFMSMMFTTLMGASGFVFKVYTDGGRDWDASRRAPSTVTATATVTA